MATLVKEPNPDLFPAISMEDWITHTFVLKRADVEPELFETKWWDYRFMTPVEATMLFVEAFATEGRKLYARDFDYERAQHIYFPSPLTITEGLRKNDKNVRQRFAELWRARQVADAAGIPYDVYVAEAMSQRMRAWQRNYLPKPGHLYRDKDVERTVARWEELCASKIYYAAHHAYMAQNYAGALAQNAYNAHLVARAGRTTARLDVLRTMIDEDRLSTEYLRRFDADTLKNVSNP